MSNSELKLLSTFFSDKQTREIILKVMFSIKYLLNLKVLLVHNNYVEFVFATSGVIIMISSSISSICLFFLDLQLEGYIHALSPVKTARNSRMAYFDCLIQTDKDNKVRPVCFDPPKRVNLQQAYQQKSPVKICGIKRSSSTSWHDFNNKTLVIRLAESIINNNFST